MENTTLIPQTKICEACGQPTTVDYVETPVSEIIADPPQEPTPFELRYSMVESDDPAYTEAEAILYAPQLTANLLPQAA